MVRAAIDYLRRAFDRRHPLADKCFLTDGVDLFIERSGIILSASESGQLTIRELIVSHLKRIEYDSRGLALRLYPFSRKDALDEGRSLVIDPTLCFGRPVLAGTGIATAELAGRFEAGEKIEEIAKDFGLTAAQVQEAIRCEYRLVAA